MSHRLSFVLVFLLVLFALPPTARPVAAEGGGPLLMPPHPSLEGKIQSGELQVPQHHFPKGGSGTGLQPMAATAPLTGSIRSLAVLVDFSDKVSTVQATFFDTLLFAAPVAGRGSVRDYFSDVSYGAVDLVTLHMPSSIGWKRAPQAYSYYVNGQSCLTETAYPNNCQKLAEDIVDALDLAVNFSQYDNNGDGFMEPLIIVHAGSGTEFSGSANDIWSHSWTLSSPRSRDGVWIDQYVIQPEYWLAPGDMTVGVFAHEMGHGFWNLPDLYDYDTGVAASQGIGNWSLMGGGSWNGPATLAGNKSNGASPAWPDAWSRIQMGFTSPQLLTADGTVTFPQAYNNPGTSTVFKIKNDQQGPQEFFLLENRQRTLNTYDQYLPGDGLLIWHIDEAKSSQPRVNNTECRTQPNSTCPVDHYMVSLEQADGLIQMELNLNRGDAGDPFPGSSVKRNFDNATDPESGSWFSATPTGISVNNISNSGASMTADVTVGTITPLNRHVYLPLIRRDPPPVQPSTWTTLMSEGFEGTFPTADWEVFDNNGTATNGDYIFARRNCLVRSGAYGGWAVGGGANGAGLPCGANYPNNADSWMVYGPFSLQGATAAEFSLQQWVNVEGRVIR